MMYSNSRRDDANDGATRKRRRLALACEICRDRKVRCNGERPACSACVRRGKQDECVYERDHPELKRQTVRRPGPRPESAIRQHFPSISSQVDLVEDREVSGRTVTTPSDLDVDRNGPLYGQSSTSTLVNQLKDAIGHDAGSRPDQGAVFSDGGPLGNQRKESHLKERLEILRPIDHAELELPPRELSDNLLSGYWKFSQSILPILHKPTFMSKYEALWADDSRLLDSNNELRLEQTMFYAMLNMVYAIGCLYSAKLPAEKRSEKGQEFYQRSRDLTNFEILDGIDYTVVQMFLLQGVYLFYDQSSKYANRCWLVTGLAIRSAQALGLDLDMPTQRLKSQLERELRRRVWYSAQLLDRLLSMIHGRNAVVSGRHAVILPEAIDDEYLLSDGRDGKQPEGIPSRLCCFVYSIKLSDILDEVLTTFYHCSSGPPDPFSPEMLLKALHLEGKVHDFQKTIPEFLQLDKLRHLRGGMGENNALLQANILYNRLYYCGILIFRPILIATISRSTTTSKKDLPVFELASHEAIVSAACNSCLKSTLAIVRSLELDRTDEHCAPIHSWLYIYYAFNVALLLIASHLCPYIDTDLTESSMLVAWGQCMGILDFYSQLTTSGTRATTFLEAIKNRICPRAYSQETASEAGSLIANGPEWTLQPAFGDIFQDFQSTGLSLNGLSGFDDLSWTGGWSTSY